MALSSLAAEPDADEAEDDEKQAINRAIASELRLVGMKLNKLIQSQQ